MDPITPAPGLCPSCPWRAAVTPTPERLQVVLDAGDSPQPCVSGQGRYTGTVCVGWLARRGPDSPQVLRAVTAGALPMAALRVKPTWPELRADVDEIEAAVAEPIANRIDPLMVALREAREVAGLSQAEAARRTGFGRAVLRSDEAGRTSPPLSRLRTYATVYGVDLLVSPVRGA